MEKDPNEQPETIKSMKADIKALRQEVDGLMIENQELRKKTDNLSLVVSGYEYQFSIIKAAMNAKWR